jgi:hypothetical protein
MSRRYKDPPVDEVSLEEFELFAVDRLRGEDCSHTNRTLSLFIPLIVFSQRLLLLSCLALPTKAKERVGSEITSGLCLGSLTHAGWLLHVVAVVAVVGSHTGLL